MLAEHGIAVVSLDLRGHGISLGVRGDTAPRKEVLADIDALIEYAGQFYPGLPLTLYGHSMGGNICLDYRARGGHNDVPDKYIVSAPWVKLVMDVSKPMYHAVKAASKVLPKVTISQKFPEKDLGNLEYVRPFDDDPLVHSKISLRCAAQCFDIGNRLFDGTNEDNHRADGKPFLLMHGDEDRICSVEGAARWLSGTRISRGSLTSSGRDTTTRYTTAAPGNGGRRPSKPSRHLLQNKGEHGDAR